MKEFFEKVAATIDYDKLSPEEIVDKRCIAKSLLGITDEENSDWIRNVPIIWKKEKELQPFLALVSLEEIEKIGLDVKQERDGLLITDITKETVKDNELLQQYFQQCQKCLETIDIGECAKRSERIAKIEKNSDELQQLWEEREELRPCIANELLREK